ncbi:RNA 2'-phosphotransferase [Caldiplasma sukawensis]
MNDDNALLQCREHGYFRALKCPVCSRDGKILMYPDEVVSFGRILTGILRHFPERYGIRLNRHGYVKIYVLVPAIKGQHRKYSWLTPVHIEAFARTDPRGRYEVEGNEIRATYDHTIPVDLSDLPKDNIPEILFFLTSEEEKDMIKESGILPSDRTYIHLSGTYRKAKVSGLFHSPTPYIIGIKSDEVLSSGHNIYRASNDVFLTDYIPSKAIVDIEQEPVELTEEEKEEISNFNERKKRFEKSEKKENIND